MNILIVTTSNARFGGPGGHPTGVWLEEFAVPYMELLAAGARIVVASPIGGAMPIDPRTSPDEGQRAAWAPALAAGQHTIPLDGVRADDFDAVFIPGGHGPMFDLPDDPHLQSLLTRFHADGKIIAAVCHGPCGLVNAHRTDGVPLVAGVTLTAYTAPEEIAAKLDKEVPFVLEERLRERGANFIARENKADHIERDGQFITGQNPASSASLARAVVAALKKEFPPLPNIVAAPLMPVSGLVEFSVGTFLENIAVSATGEIFVSSLEEGKVYRVTPDRAVHEFAAVERAAGLAFDPAGNLFASSSIGSTKPGLYQVKDGSAEWIVPMPEAVFLSEHANIVEGGPLLDADGLPAAMLIVVDRDSIEAASEFIAREPYTAAGLFGSVAVRAWHQVVPEPEPGYIEGEYRKELAAHAAR